MGREVIFVFILLHLVINADDTLSGDEIKSLTAEEDVSDEDITISDEDLMAAMVNTTETETEIVEKLVAALEGEGESESDEEQSGAKVEEENGKHVRFKNGHTAIKDSDLMLTDEQYQLLHGNATIDDDVEENEDGNHGNRTRRQAYFPGIQPWPLGVVWYMIDPRAFQQYEVGQIREAMDHWEDVSCLKFREADMRKKPKQYLYIHDQKDGCWSMLGMTPQHTPGAQPLVLEDPGCRHFGTYLHELGHAVGLIHQHQYPTRDGFLRYYPTNVDPMNANQLEKYAANVLKIFRTPYDLSSIMHYETISFSIDDIGPTLGIDNPWNARHIGARHRQIVSYNDAKTVNEIYGCSSKCSPIRLRCAGYIDKNCKCVTPSSFYKKFCKDEGDVGFCNSLVPKGECDIENYAHQKFCMKSCGFCPRFIPGQNAIGKDELTVGSGCVDRYREEPIYTLNELEIFKKSKMPHPKCLQWKQAGMCQSLWMQRYCRLSCAACKSNTGRCPNYDDDLDCDDKMTQGVCLNKHADPTRVWDEDYVSFVRSRCKDSCFNCQYKEEDRDCRNKLSDEKCLIKAQNDGCEKWPLQMFTDCPSTCGRCYWNKGECANAPGREKMCLDFALKNYCKHGRGVDDDGISYDVVRKTCGKICDTCDVTSGMVNVK